MRKFFRIVSECVRFMNACVRLSGSAAALIAVLVELLLRLR